MISISNKNLISKTILCLFLCLSVLMSFTACDMADEQGNSSESIPVTSVSINQADLELVLEGTVQLTVNVFPMDASNATVSWSTSNDTIATVSDSGLVTGLAKGTVTITVTTADGGFTASLYITVKDNSEPVYNDVFGVDLNKSNLIFQVDGSFQLTAEVFPEEAEDKSVTWSTSNSDIATVSNTGMVTAVGEGIAIITVTTNDGGYTSTCETSVYSQDSSFISIWDMSLTTTNKLQLPLDTDGNYEFYIDWGDGKVDWYITRPYAQHTYSNAAIYTVTVTGICEGFGFTSENDKNENNLIDISQWGNVQLHNKSHKFANCVNLSGFSAQDSPDLSKITNLNAMFYNSTLFNGDLSSWNTTNVTKMSSMFEDASVFNQDISDWDTSSAIYMYSMFKSATAFNQDLSDWDTSSVIYMNRMFYGASAFNQNISNWDTSSVTVMYSMFRYASVFNQDLSNWNTSNVTDMSEMFFSAHAFNGDLSAWDTSSVVNMNSMFKFAKAFNQNLSSWDVSSVTDMDFMFYDAFDFDQDMSSWDTSSVLDMSYMFYRAKIFTNGGNPAGLESWTVDEACSTSYMFEETLLSPRPSWY